MSDTFAVLRPRWAAKQMRLVRWLKHPGETCAIGEPLCELLVDGALRVQPYLDDEPSVAGIYYTYVNEGEEVGVWGELMEHSNDGRTLRTPHEYLEQLGLYPPRLTAVPQRHYPEIFLNYRKADSEGYAERLHDALVTEFGEERIFIDRDDRFGIVPGNLYPSTIQQAAAHCAIIIAVVGPSWLTIADEYGNEGLITNATLYCVRSARR